MSFEVTVTPTVYNVEVEVNPSVQPFDVVVEVGNVPDLDLTTNGDSGASTFDPLTGDLNIPEYTLDGLGGVPESRTITINGTTQDLSADRTFTIPAPDPVTIGSPANGLAIDGSQVLTIGLASSSTNGALSSTDWSTFNGKQNALGFTAENVANKAINLVSPDDTKYPTTLAVSTALAGKQNTLTNPITGTGTSGQVAFFNGTTTQTGDNGLFWDNTNKRLGIGTNAPDAPLKVVTNLDVVPIITEGYSNSPDVASVILNRRGRGTSTSPLAVQSGNVLGGIFATGYNGSSWNAPNTAAIRIFASQNYTTSNQGSEIEFANTPNGSTSRTARLRIFNTGNVLIQDGGTFTDAGFRLDVNGTARVQGELTVNGVQIGLGGGAISTNTRVGLNALNANTSAGNITAIGRDALFSNTTGTANTAVGLNSLRNNTSGDTNSALGANSLRDNTTGFGNTSVGITSMLNNTTGFNNTGIGSNAIRGKITGSNNTGTGANSGRFIADGLTEVTIANNSVFIGSDSRALADNQTNQIVIGYQAIGLGSNTTVIGNSSTTFGRWWGNLLIGTSTNSTFALDVNGTARVQGALSLGTNTSRPIFQTVDIGSGSVDTAGSGLNIQAGDTTQGSSVAIRVSSANNFSQSSGAKIVLVSIARNISPSTGSAGFVQLEISPSVNQTGGANGITRGIFLNPTLTSAFDFRAIEITRGNTFFGTTSGSVGIGANTSINASAILDITSTTQGVLFPRMTSAQRDLIATPAAGLVVYNTTDNLLSFYNGTAWTNL
jgi:hypothetical protein